MQGPCEQGHELSLPGIQLRVLGPQGAELDSTRAAIDFTIPRGVRARLLYNVPVSKQLCSYLLSWVSQDLKATGVGDKGGRKEHVWAHPGLSQSPGSAIACVTWGNVPAIVGASVSFAE